MAEPDQACSQTMTCTICCSAPKLRQQLGGQWVCPECGVSYGDACPYCGKPADTVACGVGGCPLGADL